MEDGGSPYFWAVVVLGIVTVVLLAIVIFLVVNFRKNIVRLMKKKVHGELPGDFDDVTEEEIISMVKEGHEQGVLLASEAEMIHNIFEFDDKEAKDIMTHRMNITALDGELSFVDAISFMIENSKSRYPVYQDDIDNVIGVLHIKDALAFVQNNELFRTSIKDIPNLIREVEFIPETMKINTLFKTMQNQKSHMVIVVDEYGQTSGLVAMEDILEEIVGNIEDEHDEEENMITVEADGSYRMDGMTAMEDVVDTLHIPVEEDAFETLNGLLISLLEKIPKDGETETIYAYDHEFAIVKVENNIIREVRVKKTDGTQENRDVSEDSLA
ncbi:MAG: HlyC/CorC family transporter [Agathobacter sp.]|nr:HlyC/CorC family transporter [Agathobacter sp.]MBQ2283912.1 HlyC/CorC family transporter [Agathobacter sp.]